MPKIPHSPCQKRQIPQWLDLRFNGIFSKHEVMSNQQPATRNQEPETIPSRIDTDFTRMIDVDYPIIGAPMFLISYEELAVAVARAGGLGTIPLPNFRTVDELKQTLRGIREKTDRPIGVNIHVSGKFPWKEHLALCLDFGVKFFITSLGDPRLILDDVHAHGGKVFADVVTVKQGLKARDRGIDGLIAVAESAGGHAGRDPLMILIPYLTSKVGLPVIAAGGISTGAQMAAAIALGACGIIIGTRLVATPESHASAEYKKAVIAAGPEDIVCTDKITGNPANWIKSSIQGFIKRPEIGSSKWRYLWSAGKSVAQTDAITPAETIIQDMLVEYARVVRETGRTIYEC